MEKTLKKLLSISSCLLPSWAADRAQNSQKLKSLTISSKPSFSFQIRTTDIIAEAALIGLV